MHPTMRAAIAMRATNVMVSRAAVAQSMAAHRVRPATLIRVVRPPVLTPYYIGELPQAAIDALGIDTQWRKVCWGKAEYAHATKHFPRNSTAAELRWRALLVAVTSAITDPTWVHPARCRVARIVEPDVRMLVVCLKYRRRKTREEWWIETTYRDRTKPMRGWTSLA